LEKLLHQNELNNNGEAPNSQNLNDLLFGNQNQQQSLDNASLAALLKNKQSSQKLAALLKNKQSLNSQRLAALLKNKKSLDNQSLQAILLKNKLQGNGFGNNFGQSNIQDSMLNKLVQANKFQNYILQQNIARNNLIEQYLIANRFQNNNLMNQAAFGDLFSNSQNSNDDNSLLNALSNQNFNGGNQFQLNNLFNEGYIN